MKKYVPLAGAAVLVVIAIVIPYFPRGTDLYVHVLWPWQVMRCLHEWSLPIWLPDLNAAFGSPGIGLYSPLGPSISGALGLILGTTINWPSRTSHWKSRGPFIASIPALPAPFM